MHVSDNYKSTIGNQELSLTFMELSLLSFAEMDSETQPCLGNTLLLMASHNYT